MHTDQNAKKVPELLKQIDDLSEGKRYRLEHPTHGNWAADQKPGEGPDYISVSPTIDETC
jgi:hypothetical protein